jgi:tRNA 2-thiocytidine biosynthesis protein TtcA
VVIRPLVYCAEDDIAAYAAEKGFPILPCDLCGSQDNLQRKIVGNLIATMEREHPGIRASMLAALTNVRPSHLLDKGLWKKLGLEVAREEIAAEASQLIALSRRDQPSTESLTASR